MNKLNTESGWLTYRFFFIILLLVIVGCNQTPPTVTTWEYKVISTLDHEGFERDDPEAVQLMEHPEKALNDLGKQGWELVGFTSMIEQAETDTGGTYIFKRPTRNK